MSIARHVQQHKHSSVLKEQVLVQVTRLPTPDLTWTPPAAGEADNAEFLWLLCVQVSRRRVRQRSRRSWSPEVTRGGVSVPEALQVSHITAKAAAHLLAVDPLQVEVLEPVDEEGTPQSQPDHGVPLGMDRQLLQTPHLSQGRQLHQLLDAAF